MNDASAAEPPKPSIALRDSGEAADSDFGTQPAGGSITPCLAAKTWVDFRVIDSAAEPVPHCRIRVDLPDGRSVEGVTDGDGCFGFDAIDPGMCRITLLDLPEQRCERID